jgi:hypothetical protein
MTITQSLDSFAADLVAALLSHSGAAPVRVGHPARRIPLPSLDEVGDGARHVLEATIALATGHVVSLACGGVHGLRWRVEWHERFNPKRARYVGVLDPYIRKFTTTAPAEHTLVGFAIAAHGLALAIPQSRFDGAWTALLAQYGNEGDKAFTADTLDTVRGVVMHALRVPGMRATEQAEYGPHGWPLWRFEQVEDALELPALDDEPFTLQRARRHARRFTMEKVFADLAAFATVSAEWQRTVEQFPDASFVGPQVHDVFMALQSDSHVVLIGPSGEGKSLCAGDAIAALERREFLTQVVPPVPLAHFHTPARLYGDLTMDGDWVDGPLRVALLADEGKGSVLHCTCDGDLPPTLVPLVRALLSQGVLPAGLVPGAPMIGIGERFRLVLEVTRPYADDGLPPNLAAAVQGRAHVAVVPFISPDERGAELLVHDVGVTGHQALVFLVGYVVEEVRIAASNGTLPRVLSSAEVLTWARMAVSMHGHALAGDAVPLLERAALATWVPAIPGAAAWWASNKPLALGEAVLRNRRGNQRLPDSPADWFRDAPGKRTWYRHEEVRLAIDAITSVVGTDTYLVLRDELEQVTPNGFSTNGWWNGGLFCFVCLESTTPPVDAFAEAVNVAAHERAHARWSHAARAVCFPDGTNGPREEPEAMRQLRLRQHQAYNLLEDHRIERLLDRIPDDALQTYRKRAAEIETASPALDPSSPPSRQLALCLGYFTSCFTIDPESAWDRLCDLGRTGSVSALLLMSAMNIVRLLESDPHDLSFLRDAMNLLADVFAAADGASPHATVGWGGAVN